MYYNINDALQHKQYKEVYYKVNVDYKIIWICIYLLHCVYLLRLSMSSNNCYFQCF